MTTKGKCEDCPTGQFVESIDGTCITVTCVAGQVVNSLGGCETCGKYTYLNGDKSACISDKLKCTDTQILLETGKCSDCPSFKYADIYKLTCVSDERICNSTQILL